MEFVFTNNINRKGTCSVKWDLCNEFFSAEDVLPLWVADSDWPTVPEVVKAIEQRTAHGIFGYTFPGREAEDAVINWLDKKYNWKIKREWLVFDNGVVPSINFALKALTNPGDGVVIQAPVYKPFFEAVANNGNELIINELEYKDNKYNFDLDDLETLLEERVSLGKKTAAMILCSPHNPVGRVWSESELNNLSKIAKKYDLLILSDEIHADILYPGQQHQPTANLDKQIDHQTITFMAPSKTFNIAGLHTSFTIISNAEMRKKYKEAKSGFAAGNNILGITALTAAFNHGEAWLEAQQVYLQENLQFVKEYLKNNLPEIKLVRPEGTYLIWLDCNNLPLSSEKIADFMKNKAKVGLNPGEWFGPGGKGFMRMNIACPRARLKEGLDRIYTAVKGLS